MLLLPAHTCGHPEHEAYLRTHIHLIRRLGFSFISLLIVFILVCYTCARIVNDNQFHTKLTQWPSFSLSSIQMVMMIALSTGFPTRFSHFNNPFQWDNVRPGEHCLRYATREYTSRLLQLSGSSHDAIEAMRACREIPVEIHGRHLKSNWCQDLGFGRGIYGFWIIDFEEPDCDTRWGSFSDLGCYDPVAEARSNTSKARVADTGKHLFRRLESRLENLQSGSNWQIMCVTTPAEINGRYFGSPATCFLNDVSFRIPHLISLMQQTKQKTFRGRRLPFCRSAKEFMGYGTSKMYLVLVWVDKWYPHTTTLTTVPDEHF